MAHFGYFPSKRSKSGLRQRILILLNRFGAGQRSAKIEDWAILLLCLCSPAAFLGYFQSLLAGSFCPSDLGTWTPSQREETPTEMWGTMRASQVCVQWQIRFLFSVSFFYITEWTLNGVYEACTIYVLPIAVHLKTWVPIVHHYQEQIITLSYNSWFIKDT